MKRIVPPLVAFLLALAGGAAVAEPPSWTSHPGHVDGGRFAALASPDSELVEISVTGPLLTLLSGTLQEQEPDLAELVSGLVSVSAVVVGLSPDSLSRARPEVERLVSRLESSGWHAIARVREQDSRIAVLVLQNQDRVDGLTVVVLDASSHQLVFTNIAGKFDLEAVGRLGSRLNVPGLDRVPGHGDAADEEGSRPGGK